jgi:RHS repeat-associated protein
MNSTVAKTGALTWNPNGSLKQLASTDNIHTGNTQTCSYSHDDLARIASASCENGVTTLWAQTFAFDPFGNIDKTATAGTSFLPTYNLATNQYSAISGCTPTYDTDGNLTNDCSYTYSWLADGALAVATLDVNTGMPVSLTYDALGRAVEQARGSTYTEIVYSPGGAKLALMSGMTLKEGFISLPGGGTAVYTSASGSSVAYYRHSDWLGSSRLASTPTVPTTVYSDVEYAPYGEPYGQSGTLDLNFTGQNEDTVPSSTAGLYDFLLREYNPHHGRWISPDPAGFGAVNLAAPQSWNRYAYVGNGPLNSVDSLGLIRNDVYTAGTFDMSCSIDGMAASCGLVSALGGAGGGGGEFGASCPDNQCVFNANGLFHFNSLSDADGNGMYDVDWQNLSVGASGSVIFTSGTGDDVSNRTLDGVSAFFMSGTETGTGGGSASKNKKKGKKNLESSTCSSNPDQPTLVQINGTYRDDGHLYTVSTPVAPTSDGQCRQVTNSTQCYMLTAKVDGCSIGICASQYLPFVQGPFDGILVAQPGAQKTEETNVCSQVRPVK